MDTTTSYVEEIDILKPQQLSRAIDVEVETNILEPVVMVELLGLFFQPRQSWTLQMPHLLLK